MEKAWATTPCSYKEKERKEKGGGMLTQLPPGFRFHPTDEELLTHYLSNKIQHRHVAPYVGPTIAEVDLNKVEPWDLPASVGEEEWYFFTRRDRKYPSGLRTNRATEAGYWKATGKDREIAGLNSPCKLLGWRKTLVFYKGRAPKGERTNWVMHEFRLARPAMDEWVICRVFQKKSVIPTPATTLGEMEMYRALVNDELEKDCMTNYYSLPGLLEESPPPLLHLASSSELTAHEKEEDLFFGEPTSNNNHLIFGQASDSNYLYEGSIEQFDATSSKKFKGAMSSSSFMSYPSPTSTFFHNQCSSNAAVGLHYNTLANHKFKPSQHLNLPPPPPPQAEGNIGQVIPTILMTSNVAVGLHCNTLSRHKFKPSQHLNLPPPPPPEAEGNIGQVIPTILMTKEAKNHHLPALFESLWTF